MSFMLRLHDRSLNPAFGTSAKTLSRLKPAPTDIHLSFGIVVSFVVQLYRGCANRAASIATFG